MADRFSDCEVADGGVSKTTDLRGYFFFAFFAANFSITT
jgi:hypothetical protein